MTGDINCMITNDRYFSLLQLVVQVFMEKAALNNVTIIVTIPRNVTDLQESAMEDVNQDGQEYLVIMVRTNNSITNLEDNNWLFYILKLDIQVQFLLIFALKLIRR